MNVSFLQGKTITENDMTTVESFLSGLASEEVFVIETRTVPTMRKTDNPHFDNCFKVSKVKVKLNINYGQEVKFQQVRENVVVEFTAKPKTNKVHKISGSPFAKHETTGELYLPVIVITSLEYRYEDNNGKTIDKDAIKEFLREQKMSATQIAAGITKEVIYREYKLSSIKGLKNAEIDLHVA